MIIEPGILQKPDGRIYVNYSVPGKKYPDKKYDCCTENTEAGLSILAT